MAAITTASLKYSQPFVTKVGGLLFTITNIEIPATTEEYEVAGFEIEPEKLGLTDGIISGPSGNAGVSAGGLTNGNVGAIWCSPLMEKKVTKAEAAGKFLPAVVIPREGKNPVVQVYTTGAA